MAIQDRNLSVGTKLYARYKGATHTAEVVDKEGKPGYRLADGREFKSPSAAGTAITGLACNGWAFWVSFADHFFAGATLNHLTSIHDQRLLGEVAGAGEIMRDKEQGQVLFVFETHEQVQHIQPD